MLVAITSWVSNLFGRTWNYIKAHRKFFIITGAIVAALGATGFYLRRRIQDLMRRHERVFTTFERSRVYLSLSLSLSLSMLLLFCSIFYLSLSLSLSLARLHSHAVIHLILFA